MNQAEADKSICAIIQSLPILETAPTNEKEFYPILFENTKRDWHIGSNNKENLFPVTIGERYKNGKKQDLKKLKEEGLGWYAFESVSIQKTVDMVCEGPIEGFSDNQGNTLEYKTEPSNTPQITVEYGIGGKKQTINMREENNDFLQAVKLNDIPVKEIKNGLDSFNFNEFDIDIGRNNQGEIGSYDQNMLEPQYRFISSTKDTRVNFWIQKDKPSPSQAEYTIKPFQKNFPFKVGDYIKDPNNDSQTWVVARDLNTEFKEGVDYQRGNALVNKIVYVKNGSTYQFYEVNVQYDLMIKDIQEELSFNRPYGKGIFL